MMEVRQQYSQYIMLSFSSENIEFEYAENSHLFTKLSIKNTSLMPIYYKFKVNRPRYYLVKPDRGLIQPNSTLDITIKLHKEGISEANSDKFKCFYTKTSAESSEVELDKFQERLGTEQRKMLVLVNNIPEGMESVKNLPAASSELKSLANTRSKLMSNQRGSTTYESIVVEKQDRVLFLKNQIESIQKSLRERKIAEGPSQETSSLIPLVGVAVAGILVGLLSTAII